MERETLMVLILISACLPTIPWVVLALAWVIIGRFRGMPPHNIDSSRGAPRPSLRQ